MSYSHFGQGTHYDIFILFNSVPTIKLSIESFRIRIMATNVAEMVLLC